MATKMATKIATVSMSVSCEQFTPSRLGQDIPALVQPQCQPTQISGHSCGRQLTKD
jgi:hypothetical protein